MKLIAGLGNPGSEYRGTRHNVGFEVIDELARRHDLTFEGAPTEAVIAKAHRLPGGALLAKPLTFVNLSGRAIVDLAHYYRIGFDEILVVTDDVNLPLGRLRARARGSDGGHNGLRSIIEQIGTTEFSRLRIGVGRGDNRRDLADHVLSRFDEAEKAEVVEAIQRAADAVEMFVTDGIGRVMNTFNRSEQDKADEEDDEGGTDNQT